jgi:hypothetical protein
MIGRLFLGKLGGALTPNRVLQSIQCTSYVPFILRRHT